MFQEKPSPTLVTNPPYCGTVYFTSQALPNSFQWAHFFQFSTINGSKSSFMAAWKTFRTFRSDGSHSDHFICGPVYLSVNQVLTRPTVMKLGWCEVFSTGCNSNALTKGTTIQIFTFQNSYSYLQHSVCSVRSSNLRLTKFNRILLTSH